MIDRVYIIASGPSITPDVAHAIQSDKRAIKICVSTQALFFDHDVVVICEQSDYARLKDKIDHAKLICSEDVDCDDCRGKFRCCPSVNMEDGLFRGSSTGAFALNYALAITDLPIVLFGFDCRASDDGRINSFDTMAIKGFVPKEEGYKLMAMDFEHFKDYQERILNCSMNSAIQVFEKKDWKEVLKF